VPIIVVLTPYLFVQSCVIKDAKPSYWLYLLFDIDRTIVRRGRKVMDLPYTDHMVNCASDR